MASKEELVRYLDRHVFEPILEPRLEDRSAAERKQLEDAQKRTRTEQERFHHYPSAEKLSRCTRMT